MEVYDNLIASVRRSLPAVHRYYDMRRRKMSLSDIHHYDTYVPILSELQFESQLGRSGRASAGIAAAARRRVLQRVARGAHQRPLCDRYPNQGKQSGAFQLRFVRRRPYILMNYKSESSTMSSRSPTKPGTRCTATIAPRTRRSRITTM